MEDSNKGLGFGTLEGSQYKTMTGKEPEAGIMWCKSFRLAPRA